MQELRGLSGVGWDIEQKMVEIENSSYDEYVAVSVLTCCLHSVDCKNNFSSFKQ
ncbi:hypothetical protein LINPERHAP2_LOCUS42562 [Linum perenne]